MKTSSPEELSLTETSSEHLLQFADEAHVELVVGHPRPSLSGTGVPCVSLPGLCHRVQGDSVAKRQPFFCVVVGVVGVVTSSFPFDWKRCSSFQSSPFSIIRIISTKFSAGSGSSLSNSSSCSRSHRTFLACCSQRRNPSCSRECKSVSFSED